jgi:phage repressor protein C with HTH and peptisase S24 domain
VNNNVSIHHYEKARAKAGRISSDAEAPLSFNNEFLRHNFGIKENKNIAIIYAEGNSMEPTIAAGEMLVIGGVDKDEYQDGAIYVVEYNGDMLVKRMQRNPKTGKVRLISDNTSFETIEIEGDDLKNFRIIGRIMMKTIMS